MTLIALASSRIHHGIWIDALAWDVDTRILPAVLLGLIFKYAMDMASPAVFLAGGHHVTCDYSPAFDPASVNAPDYCVDFSGFGSATTRVFEEQS